MKHLSKEDFDDLQKFYRINLINSCTGYKSANLIGSISKDGVENVAVFSSITHLGCKAPFVKGSPVQLVCKYLNEYNIEENGTILVVASIEQLYFNEDLVSETGFLRLDKGNVVTINGCDGYALPTLLDRFDYQRPKK